MSNKHQQHQQHYIQTTPLQPTGGAACMTNTKKLIHAHYESYDPPDTNHHHHHHHHHHHQQPNGVRGMNGLNGHDVNDTNNNNHNKNNLHHRKRSHGGEMRRPTAQPSSANHVDAAQKRTRIGTGTSVSESNGDHQRYDIDDELRKLYRQLRNEQNSPEMVHLVSPSFLLDKLVVREHLNVLIINLHPGNKGYSLAFRSPSASTIAATSVHHTKNNAINMTSQLSGDGQSEVINETPSWLYENAHLLDALDNEELPASLIDFCNNHCPHLYYNGTIIAQIRDYRQSYPLDICDIHHVLLRPTVTALWDEMCGAADNQHWTSKDRVTLESHLVLATAPPICLDPSPHVGIAAINATAQRAPLSQHCIKRAARRYLQVIKNRNGKLDKKTHQHQLELAMHLKERRPRREAPRHMKAACVPTPSLDVIDCAPIKTDAPQPPQSTERTDWALKRTEMLTFETDRDKCKYYVAVQLFERFTSMSVTGELMVNRDKDGQTSSRSCPFVLSSTQAARRYVNEFTEIFTEEGRKDVKITHEREGMEPVVIRTGRAATVTPKIPTASSPVAQMIVRPAMPTMVPVQRATSVTPIAVPLPVLLATANAAVTANNAVVAQEPPSVGSQSLKNLLNQPPASMTLPAINGHTETVPAQLLVPVVNGIPVNLQIINQVGQGPTYTVCSNVLLKRRDT